MLRPLSHFQRRYEEYLNGDLTQLVHWTRRLDLQKLGRIYREVVRDIDTERLDAERERILEGERQRLGDRFEAELAAPIRFLYYEYWLLAAVIKAMNLRLDDSDRRKIVDLGTGCGYFLSVCRTLGHDVFGLDAPDAYFARIKASYLDVFPIAWEAQRLDHLVLRAPILPQLPLSALDALGPLDLITAFRANFFDQRVQQRPRWKQDDWRFLLVDLTRRLTTRGRVILELNVQQNLSEFTAAHGEFSSRVQRM